MSNLEWFEYIKIYGSKPGLKTIKKLLKLLGDPQNNFESIHITGTNGKGSTTAITASIFQAASYKVGMFTTPHLSKVTESIKVNNQDIHITRMNTIITTIREKIDDLLIKEIRHPTHFEVLVAIAFVYFASQDVDIAVIEVGMGGRDDATNVIESMTSIITNVGLEHSKYLGKDLIKIAEKKADILKKGTTLISAVTQPQVIAKLKSIVDKKQSKLIRIDKDYTITQLDINLNGQKFMIQTPSQALMNLKISLLGSHQLRNAACAIAAVETAQKKGFNIKPVDIQNGISTTIWSGRFEIVDKNPLTILDCAKDTDAVKALIKTVKEYLPNKQVNTILGMSSDKNHESIIKALAEITNQFILTEHRVRDRIAKAADLENIAKETKRPTKIIIPVKEAIKHLKQYKKPNDVILVTGSVFLIGEAREYWYPDYSKSSG
jgi:dihydrofolate synthase/folylpolyglutamate synthase